jgi:hypothetical protein
MGRALAITPGMRSGANGAAMALLLVAAVAAPRAAVGQESHCGSLFQAAWGAGSADVLGFDPLLIGTELVGLAPRPGGGEPVPGQPCRGPSCSQAPDPQPAAGRSESPGVERWVVLAHIPRPEAINTGRIAPADPLRPSNPAIEGPLRPPRPC